MDRLSDQIESLVALAEHIAPKVREAELGGKLSDYPSVYQFAQECDRVRAEIQEAWRQCVILRMAARRAEEALT